MNTPATYRVFVKQVGSQEPDPYLPIESQRFSSVERAWDFCLSDPGCIKYESVQIRDENNNALEVL